MKTNWLQKLREKALADKQRDTNIGAAIRDHRGNAKPREIVKALALEGKTVSKALIARVKAVQKEREDRKKRKNATEQF